MLPMALEIRFSSFLSCSLEGCQTVTPSPKVFPRFFPDKSPFILTAHTIIRFGEHCPVLDRRTKAARCIPRPAGHQLTGFSEEEGLCPCLSSSPRRLVSVILSSFL